MTDYDAKMVAEDIVRLLREHCSTGTAQEAIDMIVKSYGLEQANRRARAIIENNERKDRV